MFKQWWRSDEHFYWMLILPAALIFVTLGLYPLLSTIFLSFRECILSQPWRGEPYVAFSNYSFFFNSEIFWKATKNTIVFVVFSVSIEFIVGFFAAWVLNQDVRGKNFFRVATLLPWSIPIVIAGLGFRFMYNDIFGVINAVLLKVHLLEYPIAWLGDKRYAMGALIFADIWKSFPIIAFLLLAGLQQIPTDLYEAAKIDGASLIQLIFFITIPLLKRVIFIALIFRTMQAVSYAFDMVYSLTRGGPGDSTQVLVTLAYKYSFLFMQFGKGSTLAILTLLVSLTLGSVFLILLFRSASQ
jgi:multiple sugar transport system permease protein